MKRRLAFSLVLLLAVVLTACQPAGGSAGGEIKLAILAPLSGPVPTFGVSTRDGPCWPLKSGMPRVAFWARKSPPLLKTHNAPLTRP
jgi:predicted small secreted protein